MPQSGILIYHCDETVDDMSSRGYPGHPNWPYDHYMVALLQADGNYDLEQGNNLGDEGDYWGKGMTLGPNDDGDTFPNTDSYQDGVVTKTGVKITVLSDKGLIMLIQVDGLSESEDDESSSNYAPVVLTPIDPGDSTKYYAEDGLDSGVGGINADVGTRVGGVRAGSSQSETGVNTTGRTIAWILSVLSGLAVVLGILVILF